MVTKGIFFHDTIAAAFVAVGGTHNIQIGGKAVEYVDRDSTDNLLAGIPRVPTGRTSQGDVTFDVWLEKSDPSHVFLDSAENTPIGTFASGSWTAPLFPRPQKLVFPGGLTMTWSCAATETSVTPADGGLVKMSVKSTPSGLINWTVT